WTSSESETISYPTEGHSHCFLVEDNSYWFGHRNDCIMAILKRFSPQGPLLDVGGGNGYVTQRLLQEGFEASLLEPGREGAFNAKKYRNIPEVICATLDTANFKDASLNAIGIFDVIEHIELDRVFIE